jgi:hypothetical protein
MNEQLYGNFKAVFTFGIQGSHFSIIPGYPALFSVIRETLKELQMTIHLSGII